MAKLKHLTPDELTDLLKDRTTKDIITILRNLNVVLDARKTELEAAQSNANQELAEINEAKNGK